MHLNQLSIGGYDNNFSYLIISSKTNEAFIIDPDNIPYILEKIKENSIKPIGIILTHSHLDHTRGTPEMLKHFSVPVYAHANVAGKIPFISDIEYLKDEDELTLSDEKIKILHTPGHTNDGICLYLEQENKIITGDTLFVDAIGRADFPDSSIESFYASISKLKKFPPETEIFPGHDYGATPTSTIEKQLQTNKYLRCKSLEEFMATRYT